MFSAAGYDKAEVFRAARKILIDEYQINSRAVVEKMAAHGIDPRVTKDICNPLIEKAFQSRTEDIAINVAILEELGTLHDIYLNKINSAGFEAPEARKYLGRYTTYRLYKVGGLIRNAVGELVLTREFGVTRYFHRSANAIGERKTKIIDGRAFVYEHQGLAFKIGDRVFLIGIDNISIQSSIVFMTQDIRDAYSQGIVLSIKNHGNMPFAWKFVMYHEQFAGSQPTVDQLKEIMFSSTDADIGMMKGNITDSDIKSSELSIPNISESS